MNPIRLHIVFGLLFILTIQLFYQTGYMVYFTLYQDSIIAKHCVNKNQPELKCDGKCHLKKMVNIEQEKEEPQQKTTLPDLEQFKNFNPIFIIQDLLDTYYLYRGKNPFFSNSKVAIYAKDFFDFGRDYLAIIFRPPII